MWQGKKISVIFPAYNEEENIKKAIADFRSTGVVDELVVVDNNCKDRTSKIARREGARVVKELRQGYGNALRCGMGKAKGDYIVLAEPDGTFDGKDIFKLLKETDKDELILGTRTNKKFLKDGANMGLLLRWGNIIVAKAMQFLFKIPPLTDCGCTFRLIKRDLLKKILPKLSVGGSHFLPEMVILSKFYNAKIVEVPVSYGPRVGRSKITGSLRKTLTVGLAMLFLIMRYRFKTNWL